MKTWYALDKECTLRGKPVLSKTVHGKGSTTLVRNPVDESIAVRLHETDILTFHKDFTVTIRAGGWYTHTTSRRIEEYLDGAPGVQILNGGADGWRVRINDNDYQCQAVYPFREGMRLNCLSGELVDAGTDYGDFVAHNKEAEKRIKRYVKLLTPDALSDLCDNVADSIDADVANGVLSAEVIEFCYRVYYNGKLNGNRDDLWYVRYRSEFESVFVRPSQYTREYDRQHGQRDIITTVARALRMRYYHGPLHIQVNMGYPRPLPPCFETVADPE